MRPVPLAALVVHAAVAVVAAVLDAEAVAAERARHCVVTDVSNRGAAVAIMAMWRLFRGDEKLFEETLAQQLTHAANRRRAEEREACATIADRQRDAWGDDGSFEEEIANEVALNIGTIIRARGAK